MTHIEPRVTGLQDQISEFCSAIDQSVEFVFCAILCTRRHEKHIKNYIKCMIAILWGDLVQ